MLLPILCFLIVLIFGVLLFAKWNNGHWIRRNVPNSKPTLILGNLTDAVLGSKHIGFVFADLYRKNKDALYSGYFKLLKPAILINDPDLIQTVLIKDFNSFSNNDFEVDPSLDPITATNSFILKGDHWKMSRNQWAAALTPSKLKGMFPNMEVKRDDMIDYLRSQTGIHVNAEEISTTFFVDIIVSSVFGVEVKSFEQPNNHFTKIAKSLFKPTFWDSLRTILFIFTPWIAQLFKLRFVSKANEKVLKEITREILFNCKANTFIRKEDYIDAQKQIDLHGKENFTDYGLTGLVFGFLMEGTQTSSSLLSFALYEIAYNPDIQNKLRKEIEEGERECGGKLTFEKIQCLPYLDMITSEVLRLYPPGAALFRVCTQPYELPPPKPGASPLLLPRGMPITVSALGLHMDPKYFPNPESFDPERFTEEAKASRHKFAYLPFGEGPRICMGSRLGLLQSKIGITGIIRNFEVRVSPKNSAKPLKMDPTALVLRPIGGLWLTFHKRG